MGIERHFKFVAPVLAQLLKVAAGAGGGDKGTACGHKFTLSIITDTSKIYLKDRKSTAAIASKVDAAIMYEVDAAIMSELDAGIAYDLSVFESELDPLEGAVVIIFIIVV